MHCTTLGWKCSDTDKCPNTNQIPCYEFTRPMTRLSKHKNLNKNRKRKEKYRHRACLIKFFRSEHSYVAFIRLIVVCNVLNSHVITIFFAYQCGIHRAINFLTQWLDYRNNINEKPETKGRILSSSVMKIFPFVHPIWYM